MEKFNIRLFARNIVNPEVIPDFITKVSKGQSDKIKVWCNTILKNYLKNEYDNLKEITKAKKTDPVWLQEAVKRKDAQEIIIDDNFERLLIEHIFHYFDTLQSSSIKHSFSEAEKQTKEWENKENLFDIKLTKGVKEILKCEGGYIWFEIIDEETLYNEGEVLQNCMRKKEHGPEYWNQIRNKNTKIFTLRDSKGVGHVGVEYSINENEIEQMVGKQNDPPIKLYHPFCIELLKFLNCSFEYKTIDFLNIRVINNKIYNIFNLPDPLEVKGDLNLCDTEIIQLPTKMKVSGNFILNGSHIVKLPDTLDVGKNLDLSFTNITKLPKNLKVLGSLDMSNTLISKIVSNVEIGKNLYLKNVKIKNFSDDIKINGEIFINYTMNMEDFPEYLRSKIYKKKRLR